jgi:hypothetical protein
MKDGYGNGNVWRLDSNWTTAQSDLDYLAISFLLSVV